MMHIYGTKGRCVNQFFEKDEDAGPVLYLWLFKVLDNVTKHYISMGSARKMQLHCENTGVPSFLHLPIDI